MPSLLSSRSTNVAIELDSIFVSGKYRESGFNCGDKMNFLFFFTKYAKIRLQLQILCQCYFVNDFIE